MLDIPFGVCKSSITEIIQFEDEQKTADQQPHMEYQKFLIKDKSILIEHNNKQYKFKHSIFNHHSKNLFHIYTKMPDIAPANHESGRA
jgi:hypothetical protein